MISSQVTDGIVNTMLRQMGAVKIKTRREIGRASCRERV